MKKLLIGAVFALMSTSASAATAYWTGKSHMTQSVTYQMVWNCEYNYAGRTFWRAFQGNCPNSIQVQ